MFIRLPCRYVFKNSSFYAVLDEVGAGQAIESLQKTMKLIATTQMIGVFFPIGLILLSIGLYSNRVFKPLFSVLLAIGAILFPIGRIGGFAIAVIGSGIFLIAAFGLIGWQIINTVENSDPLS